MALPIYDNIPELGTDAQAIARRRRIAESMLAQSQEQLPANQMVGNVVAPLSITQGLAKMLQAYQGNKQLGDADSAERGLANRRQQMVADALAGIQKTAQGSAGVEGVEAQPARTIQASAPMQEGQQAPNFNTVPEQVPAVAGQQAVAPVAGDSRKAIMDALMSNLPEVQRYGQAMQGFENLDIRNNEIRANRDMQLEQKQADRDARMEQIKMQIDSREKMGEQSNDLRAALANMQDETRRDLAAMNAANRASGSATVKPTVVMGKDGNPVYVDAKDAIGRTPVQKTGKGAISPDQMKNKQEAIAEKGKIIMNKVDEAMKELDFNTTGITGKVMSNIPGSDRKALEGALETIKANLGFEELQQMRNNSPTGGALGQVAVQELVALQSTVASLDPDMPTPTLKANLAQIKDKYKRIVDAIKTDMGGESVDKNAPEKVIEVDW